MDDQNKIEKKKKFPGIMKIVKKLIFVLAATIIIFSLGIFTGIKKPWNDLRKKNDIIIETDDFVQSENSLLTLSTIEEVLKPAADLVSLKYCYKDADTYEDYKSIFGQRLPLTTDKTVFTYEGTISAGIEMSSVKYEIDNEKKEINIELPEIKIISNEINADSFEYPYMSNSIFNQSEMEDFTQLIDKLKSKKEEKMKNDEEFMKNAKERAKEVIGTFLTSSNQTKDYHVTFKN